MSGSVVRFALPAEVRAEGALLSVAEQARAASLRDPGDRAAYVAAHLLARHVTAELLGTNASCIALVQQCVDCGGAHGRPCVQGNPRVWVTLSHTRGAVAAIAAWSPCGVDVEQVGPRAVPASALTAGERAAVESAAEPLRAGTEAWVAKEAAVKAGLVTLGGLGGYAAPHLGGLVLSGAAAHSTAAVGRWSHDGLLGAWLCTRES